MAIHDYCQTSSRWAVALSTVAYRRTVAGRDGDGHDGVECDGHQRDGDQRDKDERDGGERDGNHNARRGVNVVKRHGGEREFAARDITTFF